LTQTWVDFEQKVRPIEAAIDQWRD